MGYIQEFEAALRQKLDALDTGDEQSVAAFLTWVKGEILRSYKNGLAHKVENANAVRAVTARPRKPS